MKTIIKNKYLLFGCLLFLQCSQPPEPLYTKETNYFENYLTTTFNTNIPSDKYIYFIFQTANCGGCAGKLWEAVHYFSMPATVIFTEAPSVEIPETITQLYDKQQKIDRLNLGAAGTMIIVTENNKIKQIIPINVQNAFDIETIINEHILQNIPI